MRHPASQLQYPDRVSSNRNSIQTEFHTLTSLRQDVTPHTLRFDDRLRQLNHQMRTPISLIQIYLDLLSQTVVEPRQKEWIQHLQTVTQELSHNLTHLTQPLEPENFSTAGNFKSCDIQEILEDCLQILTPSIVEKSLNIIYGDAPLRITVDPWKIKQVFQNVLNNAISFSPIQGCITVSWQELANEALIQIMDQGPGLSKQDLRFLGVLFYSQRPGGNGLGIAIAKRMIADHQGDLWAENLPTGGAKFCISLPMST
jgi:signal transduction histidine kinase